MVQKTTKSRWAVQPVMALVAVLAALPAVGEGTGQMAPARLVQAARAVALDFPGGILVAFDSRLKGEDAGTDFAEAVYLQLEPGEGPVGLAGKARWLTGARLMLWPHAVVLVSAEGRLEASLLNPPVELGGLPDLGGVLADRRGESRVERLRTVGIAYYTGWPDPSDAAGVAEIVGGSASPVPDRPETCMTSNCQAGGSGATQCSVSGCNGTPNSCSVTCSGNGRWACCKCDIQNARCFCCID